jgi:ABC-type bacteriocin/lantibiotic exporter with double-glycine peptidase domain
MIGFKVLVTAGLLIIGGILVLNQEMNIGQFVAAEIIILLVISSVEKLILGLESFYDILTSLEKIGQVVDKELEPQDGELIFDQNPDFSLELDKIAFHTENGQNRILSDVSLKVDAKSRILVQGPSGSGKSSLLRLIAGIIEPTSGTLFVNNVALKNIQLNHYRAYVGQSLTEESPFEGTILENITFGNRDISMEDINWAIEQTGLIEFVKRQKHGLQTMLYPEGKQIPYTVSKKILLARSIVTRPKLLILKDPLDQFEAEEEKRIMDFLCHPERPWGLLVISHNPEWAKKCDRILKLNNGTITNQN